MRPISDHKQTGAALIMVLLVMALITVLAVNSSEKIRYNSARVINQYEYAQAYWYALGAEEFAKEVLKKDIQANTTNLSQDWATRDALFPIEGGTLEGSITDLHNCFNVNALAEGTIEGDRIPAAHHQFNALMLSLEVPQDIAEKLRERIRDWIDADHTPTGFQGMEFGYSTESGLGFQPPNNPILDISELWLLGEISEDMLKPILPFLCSLPDSNSLQVNINTLSTQQAGLLRALLSEKLSLQEATELIEKRPKAGFSSLDEVWTLPQLKDKKLSSQDKASFTLKSSYFRTDIQVNYQNTRRIYHAWFKIDNQRIRTIARQYGERL